MIITKTILFSAIGVVIVIFGIFVYFYDKRLIKEIEIYEKRMEKKGAYKRHFIKDKK